MYIFYITKNQSNLQLFDFLFGSKSTQKDIVVYFIVIQELKSRNHLLCNKEALSFKAI